MTTAQNTTAATSRGLAPGEESHAQAQVLYDVPVAALRDGDSLGTRSGSIFWPLLQVEGDVATGHNQLGGRAARTRTFTGMVPVVLRRNP